jgi:lipase maturation factor 1
LALCLWAFDDKIFAPLTRVLDWRFPRWNLRPALDRLLLASSNSAVVVLLVLAAIQLANALAPGSLGTISRPLFLLQPFELVNSYGLFAVMTTSRPEIVLEGSNDQLDWREYQFPYKPGNTHRNLPWVAPYQPRLDWQMWFAALGSYQSNDWVGGLMYRLLTGEPSVYRLLDRPPFDRPPHYMRAVLYEYDFTTPAERTRTGAVWQRQFRGIWFGPVSLDGR